MCKFYHTQYTCYHTFPVELAPCGEQLSPIACINGIAIILLPAGYKKGHGKCRECRLVDAQRWRDGKPSVTVDPEATMRGVFEKGREGDRGLSEERERMEKDEAREEREDIVGGGGLGLELLSSKRFGDFGEARSGSRNGDYEAKKNGKDLLGIGNLSMDDFAMMDGEIEVLKANCKLIRAGRGAAGRRSNMSTF